MRGDENYSHAGLTDEDDAGASFLSFGTAAPRSPLILSVPHAGRTYPASLLERSRVSAEHMRRLEDRHADRLIAPLIERGESALIAQVPRALIDLNRDARDIDRTMLLDAPHDLPMIASIKQRGGLGLFPRSLPRVGDLWRGGLPWSEARARIERVHMPYHARLRSMMQAARAEHGVALLLDVHSMPPLAPSAGEPDPPEMVVGDRFGASADARLAALAQAALAGRGHRVALNHPYPGFYLVERHGQPLQGMHALQIEVSRALYLDDALDGPGEGLAAVQESLTALADALIAELLPTRCQEAAE